METELGSEQLQKQSFYKKIIAVDRMLEYADKIDRVHAPKVNDLEDIQIVDSITLQLSELAENLRRIVKNKYNSKEEL